MKAWEVVEQQYDMNVLRSTWEFKLKRYPDVLIKKFKICFFARGYMQLEGIDFFETYAPVVQWMTAKLMLILEVLLGLKSKQGNVTAGFLHAGLGEDEKVFVDMPQGFEVKGNNVRNKVLKFNKMLYGLRQSPRAFWKYITSNMELYGMVHSNIDPYLFIGDKVMAIIYVDGILFWSVNVNDIHDKAMKLREQGVDLEQEDDAAGFLGVTLGRDETTELMGMKQVGIIDRVIETLVLDDRMDKGKFATA